MTDFATYTNILPDPNNPVGEAGQSLAVASGGSNGPGYSTVNLSSKHAIDNTRTNSGRLVSRQSAGHSWEISLGYNPMTREQFEPVYNFLLQKRGSLTPFLVSLPQYKQPRDATFATFVASNNFTTTAGGTAGTDTLLIGNSSYVLATHKTAKPGDVFTVTDSSDSNHTKTYQITRVETNTTAEANTTEPTVNQLRIHFVPSIQRQIAVGSTIVFNDPKFRVVMKSDVQSYSLNTENLYKFSLKLEEAQA